MTEPTDPNEPMLDKEYTYEQTEQSRDKGYYGYQPDGEELTETYSVEAVIKAEEEAKKERKAKAEKDAAKAANPKAKPTAREKWGRHRWSRPRSRRGGAAGSRRPSRGRCRARMVVAPPPGGNSTRPAHPL